ncbi:ATP-dependent Zn protease [Leptothermofonsia sp. ETS-13]|uniref:ATP-dependent Zn protease n=1 Tax=Leptothermofonsia sp. ETS-13 TaxID=3035696 RepID=UPI003BA38D57
MSEVSLNLIAVTVFIFTLASLLGPLVHLSPVVPAIATFSILSLATLDTFGWQGRGATLLLDWLASFSKEHRDRVVHHEAGHFLVAHQLGIPVTGYALNAWEAFRQGYPGNGGVQFDTQELEQELQQTVLSAQLLNRYCTIWMAGIAAETLVYPNIEGGNDDRQKLRAILTQLGFPAAECLQKERWAILQAKTLIQHHQEEYEALVSAMKKKATIEECRRAMLI